MAYELLVAFMGYMQVFLRFAPVFIGAILGIRMAEGIAHAGSHALVHPRASSSCVLAGMAHKEALPFPEEEER
jgi:hypothetical protein